MESTHTLDIDSFVPVAEIGRRYFDRPYYIAPDGKAGEEAFALIREAMRDKDRVALARIVLTNREHTMAIEPFAKIPADGAAGFFLCFPPISERRAEQRAYQRSARRSSLCTRRS